MAPHPGHDAPGLEQVLQRPVVPIRARHAPARPRCETPPEAAGDDAWGPARPPRCPAGKLSSPRRPPRSSGSRSAPPSRRLSAGSRAGRRDVEQVQMLPKPADLVSGPAPARAAGRAPPSSSWARPSRNRRSGGNAQPRSRASKRMRLRCRAGLRCSKQRQRQPVGLRPRPARPPAPAHRAERPPRQPGRQLRPAAPAAAGNRCRRTGVTCVPEISPGRRRDRRSWGRSSQCKALRAASTSVA